MKRILWLFASTIIAIFYKTNAYGYVYATISGIKVEANTDSQKCYTSIRPNETNISQAVNSAIQAASTVCRHYAYGCANKKDNWANCTTANIICSECPGGGRVDTAHSGAIYITKQQLVTGVYCWHLPGNTQTSYNTYLSIPAGQLVIQNNSYTACYLPKNVGYTDNTGAYIYTEDCYYE